jgi:hypothetical protein
LFEYRFKRGPSLEVNEKSFGVSMEKEKVIIVFIGIVLLSALFSGCTQQKSPSTTTTTTGNQTSGNQSSNQTVGNQTQGNQTGNTTGNSSGSGQTSNSTSSNPSNNSSGNQTGNNTGNNSGNNSGNGSDNKTKNRTGEPVSILPLETNRRGVLKDKDKTLLSMYLPWRKEFRTAPSVMHGVTS